MERKYSKNTDDLIMDIGRMPPNASDVEEALLGALTLEPDAFINVGHILKAEMFYFERNKIIYQTIQQMNEDNLPVDIATLFQALVKKRKK